MSYTYFPDYGSVIRDSDQKLIAPCQSVDDSDYLDYIAWVREGNTPAPPPENSDISLLKEELVNIIQLKMDTIAASRGYDSILSLCSYATSTIPQFNREAAAGVVWRDQCWSLGYGILAEVLQGIRPIPTVEEVVAMMPEIDWGD